MEMRLSSFLRVYIVTAICFFLLPYHVLYADKVPDDRQPVAVGVVPQAGIAMPTDTGVYIGFDAEYMYKIAQYANLKVTYHAYPNYTELFNGIRNGEIQMALGIAPTKERQKEFLFASNGFFTGQASIRVRSDDSRFSYGNPMEYNGKRLGVVGSSIMYTRAREWAEQSNIYPVFVLYEDDTQLYKDMDEGKLDGVIAIGSKFTNSYRSSFNIATNTYYPIFARNQLELKNAVDAAMNRILFEDSLYPEKLFDKYRHYQIRGNLPLSVEEKAYISNHPVLKVALLEKQEPFSYKKSDGTASGIAPDLYQVIARELNWQVEFKFYKTRQEVAEALHEGEVDVYGVTTQDIIASEEKNLALTKTYFTLNIVSLKRPDVTEIHTAAFMGRAPRNVEQLLRENFEGVEFQAYNSFDECYDALMDRQVDAMFCNMAQLNWLSVKRGIGELVVESVENLYTECSGQLLPENNLLNSILSKTVQGNSIDVTSIVSRNIYTEPTIMDYLRSIPARLVAGFFAVLLLVTIIVGYMFYVSHQKQVGAELNAKQAALEASEQARKAESNFLSTMSHDMRTPLNGILGYTRLAKGSFDMEEIHKYLDRIDSSGKLMLALVNDVLDLSKLASGKMEIRDDKIIPAELFGIIKSAISMNADTQHVDFKATLHAPENLIVHSDRLRLQQIAMNLLSNAVKYTPAGGHVVWEVRVDISGEEPLLIERVQDDGIGMSEEFQKHMFEIFTQENRWEVTGLRGTGLGLSLVHKFINLLGGTIEVKSQLNEGTVFDFQIPIKISWDSTADNESMPQINAVEKPSVAKDILKDIPVLLVEDNEINAELTKLIITDYGANIIDWAHNGQEALEMYSASEPSHYRLIIMDLRMPVMDGLTATREIRRLHRVDASIVPIIAISADAYAEDIQNCIEAGMQCHISKPIDVDKLMAAINDLI